MASSSDTAVDVAVSVVQAEGDSVREEYSDFSEAVGEFIDVIIFRGVVADWLCHLVAGSVLNTNGSWFYGCLGSSKSGRQHSNPHSG